MPNSPPRVLDPPPLTCLAKLATCWDGGCPVSEETLSSQQVQTGILWPRNAEHPEHPSTYLCRWEQPEPGHGTTVLPDCTAAWGRALCWGWRGMAIAMQGACSVLITAPFPVNGCLHNFVMKERCRLNCVHLCCLWKCPFSTPAIRCLLQEKG